MHITLEADYAVRIVQCLAANAKRMDAAQISEYTGVTLRFSLKILRKLAANGIVASFKGAKGGYELAKSPETISLAEVLEVVEGKYALSRCVAEKDYNCNMNTEACGMCKFHAIFSRVSDMVRNELEAVKFSDLTKTDCSNHKK